MLQLKANRYVHVWSSYPSLASYFFFILSSDLELIYQEFLVIFY